MAPGRHRGIFTLPAAHIPGKEKWTEPNFQMPYALCVDASGNIDIADTLNCKIKQISPDGTLITLAGSKSREAIDGNGTSASLGLPAGIAVDSKGVLYIADSGFNLIRKINRANDVTTLAGQDGVSGHQNGNGNDATFNNPWGVAVDSAFNVYVADTANNMIRKISPKRDVTTLAGSGTAGNSDGTGANASFSHPQGIAVDSSFNVYVADTANNLIRKISPKGDVFTLAGGGIHPADDGQGVAASFNWPTGIAVDASGNLYVADSGNLRIRKITPAGLVTTYAGPQITGIDALLLATVTAVTSTDTKVPTPTPSPTLTSLPTLSPSPTATQVSTPTLVLSPNATPTLSGPTVTETPTPTPTFTPPPTWTPTPTLTPEPKKITSFLPYGVAVDSAGNVYSVDPFQGTVWKIQP
jgi:sugar lactone lactonase YvrE